MYVAYPTSTTHTASNMNPGEIIMDGPSESLYSGGHFRIHLDFPTQFPFKPPTVSFQTKIWHPNVTNDDKGSMCLGILRPDVWKPASTVSGVLDLIRTLLIEPDVDDAVEAGIAEMLKTDKKQFEKQAKEWVKKYASGK